MKYPNAFVFCISALFHACTTDASLGVRPDASSGDAVIVTDSSDATPSDPNAWLQTLRGSGSVTVDRLLLDGHGNVVIAGRASGQVDFGGGNQNAQSYEFFVASYTIDGHYRWATLLRAMDSFVLARAALALNGNSVLVAFTASNLNALVVRSLDIETGRENWSAQIPSSMEDGVAAVASDSNGNVYISGHFRGTLRLGNDVVTNVGWSDIFVASVNAAGEPRWLRSYETGATGRAIAAHTINVVNESLLVTGVFMNHIRFGSQVVNTQATSGFGEFAGEVALDGTARGVATLWLGDDTSIEAVVTSEDGARYVVGRFRGRLQSGATTLASGGTYDIFVGAFGANNELRWLASFGQRSGGNAAIDWGQTLARATDGNLYVGGAFRRSLTVDGTELSAPPGDAQNVMMVLKLNPEGRLLAYKIGGADYQDDIVNALVTLPDGTIVVGGTLTGDGRVFDNLSLADNPEWGVGFVARIRL